MEKPILNVNMPYKSDYKERTKKVVIYESFDRIDEFYYNSDDETEDELPIVPLGNMNLQKILDKVPEGVDLSDIKMEINLSLNDMVASSSDRKSIRFWYMKKFPADLEKYKKDLAEYRKALKEYKKKQKEYDKWAKNEEIKRLQEKIKELQK